MIQRTTPRGKTHQAIAAIFADVLGHVDFGSDDDFFDRGGDSLQAIQVISRLRQRLSLPVTPALFFENTTPRLLSEAMAGTDPQVFETDIPEAISNEVRRRVEFMSGDEVSQLLDKLHAASQR